MAPKVTAAATVLLGPEKRLKNTGVTSSGFPPDEFIYAYRPPRRVRLAGHAQ
ncbi:hypothetical protein GCM10010361_56290 [Streptomyces olivaceiscleroticus]|uniref:Uncharacterized protein n=1 Tax=Streptomyces olivaceiscleroticus TaxID=68245 RepID=A0ABN1AUK9_9ACTN